MTGTCRNPILLQGAARAPSVGSLPKIDAAAFQEGNAHETSPPANSEPSRRHCSATRALANSEGASLSIAAGAPDRWFSPGGQIDIIGRLIGQWLSERLGQPFVIDNRPGAGSNIGTEAVVRASADGYTLFLASTTNAINATLYDKLSYDFIRDTVPVASINRIPLVLEANPSFPAKSVPELIVYAKANPGKINVATPSKGTGPYMAAQLFMMMTGVNMVHVPYRGSPPMLIDLLGGQIQVAFDGLSSSIEHIRTGNVRALAVATETPLKILPNIPTWVFRSGLRGERLVRRRCSEEHACRNHREAPQGDQCRTSRFQDQNAPCRSGRHDTCWIDCGVRKAHCR